MMERFRFALGQAALHVGNGGWFVLAEADDHDPPDRVVGLPFTAAEPEPVVDPAHYQTCRIEAQETTSGARDALGDAGVDPSQSCRTRLRAWNRPDGNLRTLPHGLRPMATRWRRL